ncbi:MAG: hypothetical protein PHN42_00665 [Bacilli bacterium]|nr:hypothetical protein [Bacilli bacterium]
MKYNEMMEEYLLKGTEKCDMLTIEREIKRLRKHLHYLANKKKNYNEQKSYVNIVKINENIKMTKELLKECLKKQKELINEANLINECIKKEESYFEEYNSNYESSEIAYNKKVLDFLIQKYLIVNYNLDNEADFDIHKNEYLFKDFYLNMDFKCKELLYFKRECVRFLLEKKQEKKNIEQMAKEKSIYFKYVRMVKQEINVLKQIISYIDTIFIIKLKSEPVKKIKIEKIKKQRIKPNIVLVPTVDKYQVNIRYPNSFNYLLIYQSKKKEKIIKYISKLYEEDENLMFRIDATEKTTFINKKEDLTYFQYRENVIEYLKVSYQKVKQV